MSHNIQSTTDNGVQNDQQWLYNMYEGKRQCKAGAGPEVKAADMELDLRVFGLSEGRRTDVVAKTDASPGNY